MDTNTIPLQMITRLGRQTGGVQSDKDTEAKEMN
jgi:hypothetical protein